MEFDINPGHILNDNLTNKNLGVLVHKLSPLKYIVFNFEKINSICPVFSKINNVSNISKIGNINQVVYKPLKNALLKYYRTHNISSIEQKSMNLLMDYAFPNGIPEYSPELSLDYENNNENKLDNINIGKKLFLNTTINSSLSHLNNQTVIVIDINPQGIWIIHVPDNIFYFLHKNESYNNLSGISRYNILDDDKNIQPYIKLLKTHNRTSSINYNGDRIIINIDTNKVVHPDKYHNFVYKPEYDKIVELSSNNLYENSNQTIKLFNNDNNDNIKSNNCKNINIDIDNNQYGGSSIVKKDINKKILDLLSDEIELLVKDEILVNDEQELPNKLYDEEINLIKKKISITQYNNSEDELSDNDNDFNNEEELEIIADEEITEIGEVSKIKSVPIKDQDKTYKDSIQKGDLYNFKLHNNASAFHDDEFKNKILKEINIITILKQSVSSSDGNILVPNINYQPLLLKYSSGNFTNTTLIPIVLNKKKIYIKNSNDSNELDTKTNLIIPNFYEDIYKSSIYDRDYRIIQSNYESRISNLMHDINPTLVNNSDIGFLLRLGQSNSNELSINSIDNIEQMYQNVLTIRHCNQHFNCQSIALRSIPFDYQINIGPLTNFISDNINNETIIDENITKYDDISCINMLNVPSKYRILYPGDMINIIGFLRLPLNSDITIIGQILKNDIPLLHYIDKLDNDFILSNNDKSYIFLFPNNIIDHKSFVSSISKILPSFNELLTANSNNNINNDNIYDIYKYLNKFNYDENNLSVEQRELISNYTDKQLKNSVKYIEQLDNKQNKQIKTDISLQPSFEIITDQLYNQISKLYVDSYKNYYNLNENNILHEDTDIWRIKWLENTIDYGNYFYLLLKQILYENFIKSQNHNTIEDLSLELEKLKSQKINYKINHIQSSICIDKNNNPNIIQYPSIDRLEQDNYKVATDSLGNQIKIGDYGIVIDKEAIKKYHLFKREMIGNSEMWIREELRILQSLIEQKRQQCNFTNTDIKSGDKSKTSDDICLYKVEELKCKSKSEIMDDIQQELLDINILDTQENIKYLKELPIILSRHKIELESAHKLLLDQLSFFNKKNQFIIDKENHLIEINNQLVIKPKTCIHYNIINEFNNRYNLLYISEDERIKMMSILFNKFLDEENHIYDINKISQNDDENYTYCNICNQKIFCKHYLWAVRNIESNGNINYDDLIKLYGKRINQSYNCNICGSLLQNDDPLDTDEFEGGEDGKLVKSREIMENSQEHDVTKKDIIDKLFVDISRNDESFAVKKEIYISLIILCGLKSLEYDDELEMVSFLKSFNFVSAMDITNQLKSSSAYSSLPSNKISQIVMQNYITFLGCDIAAHLLIILQTSNNIYNLFNIYCINNIIGYPLIIGDLSARNGINFMICLLNQLASTDKKFDVFNDDKLINKFIDRLKKQVDDPYNRNKILDALSNQSSNITNKITFGSYYTNYWYSYLPHLLALDIEKMEPSKTLGLHNLEELKISNYDNMMQNGRNYISYLTDKWIINININIAKYNVENISLKRTSIGNSCNAIELDQYNSMYKSSDLNDIKFNLKDANLTFDKINYMIKYDKISQILLRPNINISLEQVPLNLTPINNEISIMYQKFIDIGINKGYEHIYNEYGRCILSNQLLSDIKKRNYTIDDYNKLNNIIISKHQLENKIIKSTEIKPVQDEESDFIKSLIDYCKVNKIKFLENYFNKIIEDIYSNHLQAKTKSFDIYKHIAYLDNQIHEEIKYLVSLITSSNEIVVKKWTTLIINIGDFNKLREEYYNIIDKNGININEVNIFQYHKKITFIKNIANYWYNIINMISNKLLDPLDNKYLYYVEFKEFGLEYKLFGKLAILSKKWIELIRMCQSSSLYNNINLELISKIIHYCIIKIFNDSIESVENNFKKGILIKDIFISKIDDSKQSLINKFDNEDKTIELIVNKITDTNEYSNTNDYIDMNIPSIIINDTADESDNLDDINIEKMITKSNSKILEIVILFIQKFITKISLIQHQHDEITLEYIDKTSAKFLQETQHFSLKVMSKISENEEERNIIMAKMKILKDINYSDLVSEYIERHGDLDSNDNKEIDIYDSNEIDNDEDNTNENIEDDNNQIYNNKIGLNNIEMNETQIGNYIGDDSNLEDIMDSYE